jgi:hypothetical protein
MATYRSVLLDTDHRHLLLDGYLGDRVERYTDRHACLQYIRNQLPACRHIDFFLPSCDRDLVGNQLVLFNTVYFYVYYPTMYDIPNNANSSVWVQLFDERELWEQISYAIYRQDWRDHIQSNFSNQTRVRLQATHQAVLEEVRAAKLGIQATR